MTMPVSLTQTVDWLPHCYPHEGRHEHVAVYLVRAGDSHVLIDSGSVYHRSEVKEQVAAGTDGQGLDALVLSHSDYPHAGNLAELGAETEDVELVASSGSPPQQGLPEARKITIGDTETIQGRTFSFIDPPLADRSHTTWIYEHGDGVLFTADGFGSYHDSGRCGDTSAEFDDGIPTEYVYEYHRDNLVWLRYVNPEKLRTTLESIFEEYEVNAIAPVHGTPVVGDGIRPYLDAFYDTAARIASEYTVET